jgi:hypothetical protein
VESLLEAWGEDAMPRDPGAGAIADLVWMVDPRQTAQQRPFFQLRRALSDHVSQKGMGLNEEVV